MPYGETNPKNIFIGLIFGIIIFMLGLSIFAFVSVENPASTYGFDSEGFNNSANYMKNMENSINETGRSLRYASSGDMTFLGAIGALVKTTWASITLMFSSLDYAGQFLGSEDVTGQLHIPGYIVGLLIAVLTIIIAVWVVQLVFRRA